ncbi:hypothetical protein B566_EDAN006256 [Ephemera danica]|nr:hypothetical protein B566_EDAN006256 [Ephemera danica]
MGDIFKECNVHIIPLGLGQKRISLFETQIKKHGGAVTDQLNNKTFSSVTHVAVETDSANVAAKDLVAQFKDVSNIKLLKVEWICECLKTKSRVLEKPFQVHLPTTVSKESNKRKLDDEPSTSTVIKKTCDVSNFACSRASATPSTSESENPNEAIINELQKLADAFKNRGDTWRNYAYTKAISAIKSHGKEIRNFNEAILIPGLGAKMAAKICELLETGTLKRSQEVCGGEHAKTLELFTGVWGAGSATAQQWYALGYRTLEDLKNKATLTKQQKIGLKYYHDIQERIPREEVEEIVKIIENEVQAMFPGLEVQACGSYRRGKTSCGDIDILMFHPTQDITKTLLVPLVKKLTDIGLITDHLVNIEDGNHRKYFGLCRLQGEGQKHRRLDLFVVPWAERGPALLHYTGSAMFNRSMRLLAQKKGMSLTEHALHGVAFRQGKEKVATGPALHTPTEEDVFRLLELPYRPPEERDH